MSKFYFFQIISKVNVLVDFQEVEFRNIWEKLEATKAVLKNSVVPVT